jgi:hypothetical protein
MAEGRRKPWHVVYLSLSPGPVIPPGHRSDVEFVEKTEEATRRGPDSLAGEQNERNPPCIKDDYFLKSSFLKIKKM